MDKTVIVRVQTLKEHPKYKKPHPAGHQIQGA